MWKEVCEDLIMQGMVGHIAEFKLYLKTAQNYSGVFKAEE